jgi:hypothetical protein
LGGVGTLLQKGSDKLPQNPEPPMILKRNKSDDVSRPVQFPGKWVLLPVLFLIALFYFRYLPMNYDFDGTVFSQHLRYALLTNNIIPALHPHHLFYFPCNYLLYKALQGVLAYRVLEYFHLQLFSLLFAVLTLGVTYKILMHITGKRFFALAGMLLIAFSWGPWYYAVEAEVDLPGLFFIIAGIYFLLFKPVNTKNLVLSALLFSFAAGFHLTNGLIIFSVLAVFIYEKRSFFSVLKFLLVYFLFMAVPYFIFYMVTKFNILTLFKKMLLGGADYYAGYQIDYWSPLSFSSIFASIRSVGGGMITAASPGLVTLALLLLAAMSIVIAISAKKAEDKKIYLRMTAWFLPYLLFFSAWAPTNIGFKLNVVFPLLILFIYSLSRVQFKIAPPVLLILAVVLVFVVNFYFGMQPANDPDHNPGYRLAAAIGQKTGGDALIVIAGCGTEISNSSKIYIPYFAHRNVMILDWMLGKGLSLDDLPATLKKERLNHKTLYVLSELTYLSKPVEALLQNHHYTAADYLRIINQLEFQHKIPLGHDYFLLPLK